MELRQLLYFKIIAECNNMSQAAEILHISQPALSSALKKLEEELQVCLFERKKNKIILNDNGKLALSYAQTIIGKADEMKNTFCYGTRSEHSLSLGFCDPGPMRFSVPLFQKAFPDIIVTSEILDNEDNSINILHTNKYDAIISLTKPENTDIVTIPFAREELMLSVPYGHPWETKSAVCLHEQNSVELDVYCGSGAYIQRLKPLLEWLSNTHSVKIYDDYFVFRQILEQKNTATFTTRLVHQYRHDGDNRIIIPLEDSGISATYWLSYLKNNQKHVAPLIQWVQTNSQILFG